MLGFIAGPDFENPADAGENNNYEVVVQASDGGVTNWVQYFKVKVEVLDAEEDGEVTWDVDADGDSSTDQTRGDLLEFQAGAILTATVTDLDGPATIVADTTAWSWHRSRSGTGSWKEIVDEQGTPVSTTNTYTVSDTADNDDVGMYLRATANYTDRLGNDEANFISVHRVREAKVEDNSLPEFAPTSHRRSVQEELAGEPVGGVVTARDADDHVLNYDLVVGTAPVTPENFADYFAVNQATGQITTAAALNYETPGEGWQTVTDPVTEIVTKTFLVTVRATDSAGGETGGTGADDPSDATVTITLLNVNEAPDFVALITTPTLPENTQGIATDRAEEGVGNPWTVPYGESVTTYGISVYTVLDPEGVAIDEGKWSLEGDDAAEFQLTGHH